MRASTLYFICLGILLLGFVGTAAAVPSAVITPSTQTVNPGATFTVSVYLDTDGHKLASGRVQYLTFDPTVMETTAANIVPGNLLVTPTVAKKELNTTAGTIRFDAGDLDWALQTPPGAYMTVTYTVKAAAAPGTYPLCITWMRFMDENATVWVTPGIAVTNGSVTVRDNVPPTYSNATASPASPTTYAPGQDYTFSITVEDNVAVDTVLFEFNGINHTNPVKVGSVYSYQLTGLAAGSYSYRWHMNDTSGNGRSTPGMSYVIAKASTTVNLLLNGVDGNLTVNHTEAVNMSATLSIADTLILNVDGVDVSSGPGYVENVTTLSIGTHTIVALFMGSENYSASSEIHWLKVASPYRWDINGDGTVDDVDLGLLLLHYGEKTSPPYPDWDLNEDGEVDDVDLGYLLLHYGEEY